MSDEGCPLCNRKSLLIYPVRYAVACPRGAAKAPALAANFKIDSRAPQSVATAKYTLRALRAGYLYTYDEKRRRLRAYMVLPNGQMWNFVPGHQPPPESKVDKSAKMCATVGDMAFLTLGRCVDVEHDPDGPPAARATKFWIGWSNVAWTKALVELALSAKDGPKWRAQHMQCIDVESMISGHAPDTGEFQASRAHIAPFAMDRRALKDAFDFSNTPINEESRLRDLADRIGGAMAQTTNKKGFVVAVNDPVGMTNDLAELTVPSQYNGFDKDVYWKYISAHLLESAEAGIRGRAEATTKLTYGISRAIEDANAVNMDAGAPDTISFFRFVRSWIKTGSMDQALKIEQQKSDDVPATAQAASDRAWDEASLKMGPDGKPVIGPDHKPVSLIDTDARDRFLKQEYPQALDAFKPQWSLLVKAHADWLSSQLLADWMAGNHDVKDLRSGYAYSESCAQAVGTAAGTEDCQKVLEDWLSGQASDTRNLYARALMFNHEDLIKAADAQVHGSDIQYENFLNIYKEAFSQVEKDGAKSSLRDRLVVATANTVVNVLAKGAKGAAIGFVTVRLALHAGVRIKAANITHIQMKNWVLDQGKLLGLKLEGNRVQRRAAAAKVSRAVLSAAPPSDPAVFGYELDTDAWVKAGKLDASDVKVIKIPGVETTRKWLSSGSSIDFNMGVATAIFQIAAVKFAWNDYAGSDHFDKDENFFKLAGSVVSIVGNVVEKVSETVANAPAHPLAAYLTRQLAWFDLEAAEKGVVWGRRIGVGVGLLFAGYDMFENAPASLRDRQYWLAGLYGVSGVLGASLSLSPYLTRFPFFTVWFPPAWELLVASILLGFIIVEFKPAAINDWIPRSRFGTGKHYRNLSEELRAYNSAVEG